MSIRNRLTLQFALLASLVLSLAFLAIYLLSANYRKDEFVDRLRARGENTAKLLIQVDEVDENLLQIIERDNPVQLQDEQIIVFDYKDSVIYHRGFAFGFMPEAAFVDLVRRQGEVQADKDKRESVGFVFSNHQDRYVVVVSAMDVYGRRKSQNLIRVLASVMALGMLTFFLVGRVYAERALNPIKVLVKEITGISFGNLDQRANEGDGADEVAQLAIAFNAMLTRLEEAFTVQRNFIANASHEMRTPLTAISGQLEVLQMKERSGNQYREAIASVLLDIHSLNVLANRLLLLAHAGTDAAEVNFREVRVDDVVWEARTDLLKAWPDHTVSVSFDASMADLEALMVFGSDLLLKTMMLNLMENGCKYSDDHHVSVRIGIDQKWCVVVFADHGIGIPPQDMPHIFQPFYRSDSTREHYGHGIGLSLVRRIIDLHKGKVEVKSIVGKGSEFTVLLPLMKL